VTSPIHLEGHQNEAASLDSKYKAIRDAGMGTTVKQKPFSYRKDGLLLLALDSRIDDLGTQEEVGQTATL
jgi:hypothetical protein